MDRLKPYQQLMVRVQLIRDGPKTSMPKIIVDSPEDVYLMIKDEVLTWDREKVLSIMLNSINRIIAIEEICVGSLTAAIVHPREVFKSAILANAAALILVHNHASSENPNPSNEDKKITEKLIAAGEILDIKVMDHLIIAKEGYVSLVDYEDQPPKTENEQLNPPF